MVHVRLAKDWQEHHAGDEVDVDAATLATLEAQGIVSPNGDDGWGGPGASGTGKSGDGWGGPG